MNHNSSAKPICRVLHTHTLSQSAADAAMAVVACLRGQLVLGSSPHAHAYGLCMEHSTEGSVLTQLHQTVA